MARQDCRSGPVRPPPADIRSSPRASLEPGGSPFLGPHGLRRGLDDQPRTPARATGGGATPAHTHVARGRSRGRRWRWAVPTSPPRRSRRVGRRVPPVHRAHCGGRRQTGPPQQCPREARTAGRTPLRQRRGSSPLPRQDVRRRRRCPERLCRGDPPQLSSASVSAHPGVAASGSTVSTKDFTASLRPTS